MYKNSQDLPDEIKQRIPSQYWGVYISAYNNAWKDFDPSKTPAKRREDFAHEVGLSAAMWPGQHPQDSR